MSSAMPHVYTGQYVDPAQFKRKWLDVPYATASPSQKLDIYLPDEGEGPFPVVVLVHGGGWCSGDKRGVTMLPAFKLPSQGYALVSVEWRFGQEEPVPAMIHDAKAAIRFIRAHQEQYLLDGNKVAIWGNSSGGYIANMVAATGWCTGLIEDLSLGWEDQHSEVQALVSWYAVTDMFQEDLCCPLSEEEGLRYVEPGALDQVLSTGLPSMQAVGMGFVPRKNYEQSMAMSPVCYVESNFPPALFQHGMADPIVPFTQSVAMVRLVNDAAGEQRAKLDLFDGAVHGDPVIKSDENLVRVLQFLDEVLLGKVRPHENLGSVGILP